MKTNSGNKTIKYKGGIPIYEKVIQESKAVSNLFSLSDMLKHDCSLKFDSEIKNEFAVIMKDGCLQKFGEDVVHIGRW